MARSTFCLSFSQFRVHLKAALAIKDRLIKEGYDVWLVSTWGVGWGGGGVVCEVALLL